MVGSPKFHLSLSSMLISFSPDLLGGKEKIQQETEGTIFFINSFEI
jgi:hypothetical protein